MGIAKVKQQIWSFTNQDLDRIKAAVKACQPEENTIQYWQRVLLHLQSQPVKTKAKRKVKEPDWVYERYNKAYRDYQAREFPTWVKDGHTLDARVVDTSTGNGLNNFCVNFLTWSGHFANRTGNEGRVIMKDDKPLRIPSQSKNGMQDVDANLKHPKHPFGIPWKIETKAGKDSHKKHQKEFGEQVRSTGAVYSVVRSAEDFLNQYDELINLANS